MVNKNNNFSINDLTRIRKLIIAVIKVLEESIFDFSEKNMISQENKELIEFLFGKKCDIVSIITKLTNVLIKLVPLEEKISDVSVTNEEKLNEDDLEILRRYIKKCNFWFNNK